MLVFVTEMKLFIHLVIQGRWIKLVFIMINLKYNVKL